MFYKKVITMMAFVLCIVMFLTSCEANNYYNMDNQVSEENTVMKMVFYPTGGLNEVYFYTLTKNKTLNAIRGMGEKREKITLKRTDDENNKQLSDKEFNYLIKLLEEIYSDNSIVAREYVVQDSWNVNILYKNKEINQDCFINPSDGVKKLCDEIIKMSPITINLHDFA